jgi:hypothetical protein
MHNFNEKITFYFNFFLIIFKRIQNFFKINSNFFYIKMEIYKTHPQKTTDNTNYYRHYRQ